MAIVLAVGLGGLSGLMLALGDESERISAGLFLAGLATATLWGLWFSRLMLLQLEARQGRMPGVSSAVGTAAAIAFVATVVIPALLLAPAGVPVGIALCALAAAACTGTLLATLPRLLYMGLCFLPALLIVAGRLLEALLPAGLLVLPWRPELADIAWLLPPLVLLASWRWHGITRGAGDHGSPWWQPAILTGAKPGADWGWYSGGKLAAQMPDIFWPAGQTGNAGPDRPVRSMRALLGTPFAPLTPGQLLVQFGFVALAIGYVALESAREGGDLSLLASGVIGVGAVTVLMYGQRLEALYSRRSTELDELALLPGFGDPAHQRATVLKAVALSPTVLAMLMLALLLVVVALLGPGWAATALLVTAGGGILLAVALACLRPLAGLDMNGWRILALAGPVMVLALVTTVYAAADRIGEGAGMVFALLWVLAYAILGTMVVSTIARLRARPHPFLPY